MREGFDLFILSLLFSGFRRVPVRVRVARLLGQLMGWGIPVSLRRNSKTAGTSITRVRPLGGRVPAIQVIRQQMRNGRVFLE